MIKQRSQAVTEIRVALISLRLYNCVKALDKSICQMCCSPVVKDLSWKLDDCSMPPRADPWKPRFLWQWPSAHLHFLVSCFSFSSWFSMGFRSGEFAGQSSTPTPWSFNQLLVLLAVWAGAKSCWKMKSASLKSWSAEGSMKCSKQMTLHPKSSQTVET